MSHNGYAHYSPATDTQEIRSDLRGPYWSTETVELHLLDLRPAVTRVERPNRLARLVHRVRTSEAADHLRASASLAFWPAVLCAGLLLAVVTRGQYMAFDGLHDLPTTGGAQ